jgi:hypothetical protein
MCLDRDFALLSLKFLCFLFLSFKFLNLTFWGFHFLSFKFLRFEFLSFNFSDLRPFGDLNFLSFPSFPLVCDGFGPFSLVPKLKFAKNYPPNPLTPSGHSPGSAGRGSQRSISPSSKCCLLCFYAIKQPFSPGVASLF